MKKFILMICAALLAEVGSIAQVIESDYKKVFVCDILSIDLNQNGEIDSEEVFDIECFVSIDFRDFGSAGNLLTVSTFLKRGNETSETASSNFEDVRLINIPPNVKEGNGWALLCKDFLGDTLFMISDVSKRIEGSSKMFHVSNLAVLD